MAVYTNNQKNAAIGAIEFTPVASGNFSFIYLRDEAAAQQVKQLITAQQVGQTILAETKVAGRPVIISQGGHSQQQLMQKLEAQGGQFAIHHQQKKIDPWTIRSWLGFAGQSLQLAAAFMSFRPSALDPNKMERALDWGTFVFAGSNMTANAINLIYGAQDRDDPHQLRFLKEKFNKELGPQLAQGEKPIDVEEHRAEVRKDPSAEKPNGFHEFMTKHSVSVGELGLRYFGAFGLAFPVTKWGQMMKASSLTEAYKVGSNTPLSNFAGLASIFGKSLAQNSKIADPYDPKPHSWLDKIREKYTFLTGGLVEAVAFTALGVDRYKNKRITFGGKQYRDYVGAAGAALFVTGYIVRSWAQYGVRHVDMDELYAHVSDTLAKLPPEKLPQLLADTAAEIKDHFKDQNLDYGAIYTHLATDLMKYHHITVKNMEDTYSQQSELNSGEAGVKQPSIPPTAQPTQSPTILAPGTRINSPSLQQRLEELGPNPQIH